MSAATTNENSSESELYVEQIQIGPMQNFTYIVGSNLTKEVVLIDPAWEIDGLLEHVQTRGFDVTGALITHYHPDHCGGGMRGHKIPGVAELLEKKGVKIYAHKLEADGLKKVTGISDTDLCIVDSGDKMKVGNIEVEFLHTPGHTPGSQCFRIKHTLISGDTLFVDGCGRVDLPGSNPDHMWESLQKLIALPDDTLLLPGHNYSEVPNASMAQAKKINMYLRVPNKEAWQSIMGVGK